MIKNIKKPDGTGVIQYRLAWFILGVWIIILVLVFRFAWLQIGRGAELAQRAMNVAAENQIKQTPRGKILDRNGRELAISRMAKSLGINPSKVDDPDTLAEQLSPLINVPAQEIKNDIAEGGGFVWVKRRLEPDEESAVRQLRKDNDYYECIDLRDEVKRYYPNDMLAANILGFIGTDDKGLDGIEQELDSIIKGEEQESEVVTDMADRPIFGTAFKQKKYKGDQCKDVTLTIDSTIQFIVEQALDKAMLDNNPKAVTAIVMDPKNGDVLAMASRPSFNPNRFWEYPSDVWRNRGVSFIYEPGSTFKAMVSGAALQEKAVTPDQVFVDPGYVMVSERRIQNWNGASFGTVTFTDIVKNSINTGFAQVGLQLGGEKLTDYAKNFGFGEYTGIELPGEECGLLFDPADMRDSDIATMAIGQSIAVTPLQLITAMSAIANDGVLLKPHIVKTITNADGSIYKDNGRTEVRRVLESATDKTLMGLLEQVVATGGGAKAAVKGYRIAGKTGTAQKIREDGVGYMDGRYIASFCGFAPVEDPRFTVLVVIDDPSGIFYGGQIAAPVAKEIFAQLFRYMHIEPSSDPFVDMDKDKPFQPQRTIAEQHVQVPNGKVLVPDLKGKSIREASQTLAELGISIRAQGSGVATGQDVPPYTVVDPGITVTVYFSPAT